MNTLMEMTPEPMARMTSPTAVRLERLLPGPVERVWTYLTDPDKRALWFAGGPMDLRVGGAATLTFRNADLSYRQINPDNPPSADGIDHVLNGVITRCEPPNVLAFNWNPDGSGSESTFYPTQEGDNTRVVITHERISSRKAMTNVSAGWHVHIGLLIDLLSERPTRSFWPEHTRLVQAYGEHLGA